MRKYIIVRKWAWTSFWDISFGNRIGFWEFAQTINKINNYKYTLLVQSENVDVWGESYFINYPNTIVIRSFPDLRDAKVRLIDNARNYHEGTFEEWNQLPAAKDVEDTKEDKDDDIYFDLRGEGGIGKESFLDKVGGLSSLIDLTLFFKSNIVFFCSSSIYGLELP